MKMGCRDKLFFFSRSAERRGRLLAHHWAFHANYRGITPSMSSMPARAGPSPPHSREWQGAATLVQIGNLGKRRDQ